MGWFIYLGISIFIITAVSNATNLTDGLDGLATGITAICGIVAIFIYQEELIFPVSWLSCTWCRRAHRFCISFSWRLRWVLWYNTHPASVFMGDTGSLAIGGARQRF